MYMTMFVKDESSTECRVFPVPSFAPSHVVEVAHGPDVLTLHFGDLEAVLHFARVIESEALMLAIESEHEVAV